MKIIDTRTLNFSDNEIRKIISDYCIEHGYNVSEDNISFNFAPNHNYGQREIICTATCERIINETTSI